MSDRTERSMDLSPEKEAALIKFKSKVVDIIKPTDDDYSLLKWLIARDFDVNRAEAMFRESTTFKQKMKADTLIKEYTQPEVLKKYYAAGSCGVDREGSPVVVELFGHLDMKGLMLSAKKSDFEKTKLWQCETIVQFLAEQSEKMGRRVDGITVIFDMENVGTKSLWRPGLHMYLHMVKVLEDNYPELLKRMFVVNAPSIFPLLYKLCRPLLSDDMRQKIHVLSSNDFKILQDYIDPDQLPAFLGGRLTDPDGNPRCPSMICQGGEVPRSYYLSESLDNDDMETAVVPARASLSFDFPVTCIGAVLRWEFRTEDYDISFGVTFRGVDQLIGGQEDRIIRATEKVNSHVIMQDGSIDCDRLGTYTVIFDNASSWARSKKLWYRVELHQTDEQTDAEVGLLALVSRN